MAAAQTEATSAVGAGSGDGAGSGVAPAAVWRRQRVWHRRQWQQCLGGSSGSSRSGGGGTSNRRSISRRRWWRQQQQQQQHQQTQRTGSSAQPWSLSLHMCTCVPPVCNVPSPRLIFSIHPHPQVRTDTTYPAGFMDVIDIPTTDEHFRLVGGECWGVGVRV